MITFCVQMPGNGSTIAARSGIPTIFRTVLMRSMTGRLISAARRISILGMENEARSLATKRLFPAFQKFDSPAEFSFRAPFGKLGLEVFGERDCFGCFFFA